MQRVSAMTVLLLLGALSSGAGEPNSKPVAENLKNPTSAVAGADGRTYIAIAGELGKDGDGEIVVVDKGKVTAFATGLNDPTGLAFHQKNLFVADKDRILRIDAKGKATVLVAKEAFPKQPINLQDLTVDTENGTLYVSDAGRQKNEGGAVYRITQKGKASVSSVIDQKRWPELQRPTGLALDGGNHLLVLDGGTGQLHRVKISDGSHEKVADGFGQAAGLTWDWHGRLYISDTKSGKVSVIGRPGAGAVAMKDKFQSAVDLALDPTGKSILVVDQKAGKVTAVAAQVPGAEVDERPLDIEVVPAFPKLKWAGWTGETEKGLPYPIRPVILTHAGDSSNRIFAATEQGVVHVFPNDPKATTTEVFLDIQPRVTYLDKENEEGFLGMAFHPQYKKNGEFFVLYTSKKARPKHVNILSRFRVSKDNPNRADPDSEEEILRIDRPFWNHAGGTICFGPDGYLYLATGDGGSANDPMNNGQNLKSWLGKILRIDVDRKDPGLNYAIPKDNPFVGRDDARPETWAYGLRNVWRMSFDRKTGKLWASDVGQNLYEEINIIEKGGNYGWKVREAMHPFSAQGSGPRKDLIDPIWEYHHRVGLSITGGHVYRGKLLPELDGHYLYGDYVSNKVYALKYDDAAKRVVANRPIRSAGVPILSFGEDEQGEVYYLTFSPSGRAIYGFARTAK